MNKLFMNNPFINKLIKIILISISLLTCQLILAGTITVNNGGSIKGTGTLTSDIIVKSGGAIEPGQSPGCLAMDNLDYSDGGTLSAEIGGSTACSGYDQLQVTGTVTLGATLSSSIVNSYVIVGGESYTLIDNDGAEAVNGIFTGLSEGSLFTLGGKNLSISYVGGDGNDVALKALADQLISFSGLSDKTFNDTNFTVSASASSGLSVTFSSNTTSVCSITGNTVSLLSGGSCSITAEQSGSVNYNAATNVTQVFSVNKASQTVSLSALADKTIIDTDFSLTATATSGLSVSYATTTASICSVTGNTVSILAVGSCSLTLSQSGDGNYNAAADVVRSFSITKALQTISFLALNEKIYGDAAFNLSASSDSGLSVSFASTTTSVCTVSGSSMSILTAGSCSITATQSGDSNYNLATDVVQAFTVSKAEQIINFSVLADKTYGDVVFSLSAASDSGLSVSFASTTASVCTVSGSSVSILTAGSCSITATQSGDSNYNAATDIVQALTVNKASQTISFQPLLDKLMDDVDFSVSVVTTSNLSVSIISNTNSVCTASGTIVSLISMGTCELSALQSGNDNYLAATNASQSFTVNDVDTDNDGIPNNLDTDDDNDGVLDTDDAFPLDDTESVDTDGDGIGNNADTDDDGDGVLDTDDAFPLDDTESVDTDGDGIGNNADTDDDGDGVLDTDDAFPLDENESQDSDGDGIGDNSDPTPYPPSGELNFNSVEYSVAENGVSVEVTVLRTDGEYGELSIDYSLQDGSANATTDYEFAAGTLTFADGETSQTITINIVDDFDYEGNESFSISLSHLQSIGEASIGSISSATITIEEDDAVPPAGEIAFEFDTEMVNENDDSLSLSVIRTGGSLGEISVSYSTSDITAVAGIDYAVASGSLTFVDGETTKTISIDLVNDDSYESDETFTVQLSNLIGDGILGNSLSTVTILDDEIIPDDGVLEIENAAYTVNENGVSIDINIVRTAGDSGEVSVDISTADSTAIAGEDYQSILQTLTFVEGELSKIVTVNITDDSIYEGDESFNIILSNVAGTSLGNQSTSTITIVEDDEVPPAGVIQFSGASYSVNESESYVLLTITRTNGSFGEMSIDVNVSSVTAIAGEDYLELTEILTFLDGETSLTISITLLDDDIYEGNEEFNVVLSNLVGDATLGNPSTATVTIVENEEVPPAGILQLSGASYTVGEADGSLSITVQRTDGSYGDVSVDYLIADGTAANGSDYSTTNGSLFFADGEMSQTITVDIINDTTDESTETFTIELLNPMGATLGDVTNATVSIEDNDNAPVVVNPPTSSGGGSVPLWLFVLMLARLNFRRRDRL